jgi:hypothetical protein
MRGRSCSTHVEEQKGLYNFGGKARGLGVCVCVCVWKNNIKIILKEIVWVGMDWIRLVQERKQ